MRHLTTPNLPHLQLFWAVARAGSVSRAAAELHTSQPALSRQIRALEAAFGEQLFERLPRGVRLTPAGEVAFRYADRIFAIAAELCSALVDLRDVNAGRLLLGASSTPAEYLLPPVLARYRARYPGVALNLVTGNTAAIVEQIERHALDMGFVGSAPPAESAGLEVLPVGHDELVIVAAPAHPLAARQRPVTVAELAGAAYVAREAGSATRATAEWYARALGLHLEATLELGGNEAVKRAVMTGTGYAVLSRHALISELAAGHLAIVAVRGWDCRRDLYLVRRTAHVLSRAEQAFLTLLNEVGDLSSPALVL